ncbi:Zinc finger and BTB domain-containing protein 8A.1-B [Armadillidium vulgare]|nr:Zinc finger and BTB domain-containing protein 8A.1-B [Armadillidium vulgare]
MVRIGCSVPQSLLLYGNKDPFEENFGNGGTSLLTQKETTNTYQCHLCPYKSVRKYNLKQHVRIHTGEKPHLCAFCDKKFAAISNLRNHMKNKHDVV